MNENEIQVVPQDIVPEALEKPQEVELITNVGSDEQIAPPKSKLTVKKKKVLAALGISLLLFIGSAGYICMNLHIKNIPSEDHLAVSTQPSLENQTTIGVTPVLPATSVPVERALHQIGPIRTVQSFAQFQAKRALNQPNFRQVRSLKRKTTSSLPHVIANPFARSNQKLMSYIAQRNKQRFTLNKPVGVVHPPAKRIVVRRNLRGQVVHRPVTYRKAATVQAPIHRRRIVLRRRPVVTRRAVLVRKNSSVAHSLVANHKVIVRQHPQVHRVLRRIPLRHRPGVHRIAVLHHRPTIRRRVPIKRRIVHHSVLAGHRAVSHFPQSNVHKDLV